MLECQVGQGKKGEGNQQKHPRRQGCQGQAQSSDVGSANKLGTTGPHVRREIRVVETLHRLWFQTKERREKKHPPDLKARYHPYSLNSIFNFLLFHLLTALKPAESDTDKCFWKCGQWTFTGSGFRQRKEEERSTPQT
jgi:hypothetical protein